MTSYLDFSVLIVGICVLSCDDSVPEHFLLFYSLLRANPFVLAQVGYLPQPQLLVSVLSIMLYIAWIWAWLGVVTRVVLKNPTSDGCSRSPLAIATSDNTNPFIKVVPYSLQHTPRLKLFIVTFEMWNYLPWCTYNRKENATQNMLP